MQHFVFSIKQEFAGNTDRNTPVEHSFIPKQDVRIFRINILAYHDKPALRLEIFGCHKGTGTE